MNWINWVKRLNVTNDHMNWDSLKLTRQDADIFYMLSKYYDPTSQNIAVLGDSDKFKRLKNYYDRTFVVSYNPKNWAITKRKAIKINDTKVTYIVDNIELTIVVINTVEDLAKHNLKYRKYC